MQDGLIARARGFNGDARTLFCLPGLVLLGLLGCGDEFDPASTLKGFRLLAIRADKPAIVAGETAALDALVVADRPAEVAYRWSWCPYTASAAEGYRCALSEAALRGVLGPDAPPDAPPLSYALGSEPTASFALPAALGASLEQACLALRELPLPDFVEPPRCTNELPITVRLEVSSRDETISAIKRLTLLFDSATPAAERNANPDLRGLSLDIVDEREGESQPQRLARGHAYLLRAHLPERAAQSYLDAPLDRHDQREARQETLTVSWFVPGGELEEERTGFIPGERSLERAGTNTWTTPERSELGGDSARLYLVVRDNRGGVSWLDRAVLFDP